MDFIVTVLGTTLFIVLLIVVMSGCASIDKESATLIPAKLDHSEKFEEYFPDLISSNESMRPLTPGATTDREKYSRYMLDKLGCVECKTSDMSVVVRDRTKIPPFLPIDINLEKELLGLYLNKDLTSDQKEKLASIAAGNLFNVPDLPNRTAIHDVIPGKEKRYFYYPRIQIDFASRLRSPSQLDRFSYLGLVFELKTDLNPKTERGEKDEIGSECKKPRIIDFYPKAADIMEYAHGELTQKAEVASKASLTGQDIDKITGSTSADTGRKETGVEQSRLKTITPELSLSMSETFVNALKDSIEARTAGVLQQGQAFFADFRAIKSKRIGGTYNFDMMLEVPASLESVGENPQTSEGANPQTIVSKPCVTEIRADVYMVAVVRHVFKPGYTGWWTRAPDPDKDKTYYQVVTQHVPDIVLWKYGGVPWVKVQTIKQDDFTVLVTTNRSDAKYVVKSTDSSERILATGSGAISRVSIPAQIAEVKARVEFLDVIEVESGKVHVFSAPLSSTFTIEKAKGGERSFVGNYGPKSNQ